jgi:hypothetical protein
MDERQVRVRNSWDKKLRDALKRNALLSPLVRVHEFSSAPRKVN